MNRKKALYLLLSVSLIFSACFNSKKKEQISQKVFVEVFKELETLKVEYEIGIISDSIYNLKFEKVFLKNNLKKENFQIQMDYYLENLSEFESILKELELQLESN